MSLKSIAFSKSAIVCSLAIFLVLGHTAGAQEAGVLRPLDDLRNAGADVGNCLPTRITDIAPFGKVVRNGFVVGSPSAASRSIWIYLRGTRPVVFTEIASSAGSQIISLDEISAAIDDTLNISGVRRAIVGQLDVPTRKISTLPLTISDQAAIRALLIFIRRRCGE